METILVFSIILWLFLDRFKKIWQEHKYGNYITNGVAVIVGLGLAFGYQLDLLKALDITVALTIGGEIFAGLAIACGSSLIYELIQKVSGVTMDEVIKLEPMEIKIDDIIEKDEKSRD